MRLEHPVVPRKITAMELPSPLPEPVIHPSIATTPKPLIKERAVLIIHSPRITRIEDPFSIRVITTSTMNRCPRIRCPEKRSRVKRWPKKVENEQC
ncbi:hypothetical protein AKJ16_DCAP11782 [Drosera capensis]